MRVLTSRCVAQSGLSTRVGLALLQDLEPGAAEVGDSEEGEQQETDDEESEQEGSAAPSCDGASLPTELRGPPFDLLLLDPCFSPLRRQWAGVQFCEIVRLRRWAERVGIVTTSTPMLPGGVQLRAVLLECPDLWRRHQPVDDVSGVNVRAFNKLLAPRQLLEARSLQLWQWAHRPLSAPFTWGRATLPLPSKMQKVSGEQRVLATGSGGVCHAVCVWIDFEFAAAGAALSTGPPAALSERMPSEPPSQGPWDEPTPWAQGVCFLPRPVAVSIGEGVDVALELDLLTAALKTEL